MCDSGSSGQLRGLGPEGLRNPIPPPGAVHLHVTRACVCACTPVANTTGTIAYACAHVDAFASPAAAFGASKTVDSTVALGRPFLESSTLFMMKR